MVQSLQAQVLFRNRTGSFPEVTWIYIVTNLRLLYVMWIMTTWKVKETSGKCFRLGLRHTKGKMTLVRSLQVYQRIETRIATRLGVSDIWQRNETRFRTGCRARRWVLGSRCLPTLRHLRRSQRTLWNINWMENAYMTTYEELMVLVINS